MNTLTSTKDPILEKLQQQNGTPTVVFSDFDGTLFAPDVRIVTAPFYNLKTKSYLTHNFIPFIVVTGRSDWQRLGFYQTTLLGLPQPDAVIAAAGTIIYYQTGNSYVRDLHWDSLMHYAKVKWKDGKKETWNKAAITQSIQDILSSFHIPYKLSKGNTFLIRLKIKDTPLNKLEEIRKGIIFLFPFGIKVSFSEKLMWSNDQRIFSGDIIITPRIAGKENAVKYLLEKYAKSLEFIVHCSPSVISNKERYLISTEFSRQVSRQSQNGNSEQSRTDRNDKRLHSYIFGDATIDVGMLALPETPMYSLAQFGVHLTPLAKHMLERQQKSHPNLGILEGNPPEEILRVVTGKAVYRKQKADEPTSENKKLKTDNRFSPAQNNPVRLLIKKIEPLLDHIIDKNLSANEVSFLGLQKLSEGIGILNKPESRFLQKINGLYKYGFGNLTDILDGIRARQNKIITLGSGMTPELNKNPDSGQARMTIDIPGQLIDGFSDRVKEFLQLFARGKKHLLTLNLSAITFLTALSCTLPSIARAEVEITGKIVEERDEKGGSMIDRTKKLFLSLLVDTIGAQQKSQAIDQKIYTDNIATFKNRLSYSSCESEGRIEKIKNSRLTSLARTIKPQSMSDFELKALERWLLYIEVLQQEDSIIQKFLTKYPPLLKEYQKESRKLTKEYLELPIAQLRRRWKIKDYKLKIQDYV